MISLYMLDTNMVSYIVKGRSPAASNRLLSLRNDEIATISAVTAAEILYGLAKKPEATALANLMQGFLAGIQVLPWRQDEAEVYGQVRAALEKDGLGFGNMDMMIAAHAIAVEATLVTNDKAFAHVKDLTASVNWATDL